VSLELGAILEPLSVAINATRRAQMVEGSLVLVFGVGTIGLLCGVVCKAARSRRIIITDVQSERVDFASEHGFAD